MTIYLKRDYNDSGCSKCFFYTRKDCLKRGKDIDKKNCYNEPQFSYKRVYPEKNKITIIGTKHNYEDSFLNFLNKEKDNG